MGKNSTARVRYHRHWFNNRMPHRSANANPRSSLVIGRTARCIQRQRITPFSFPVINLNFALIIFFWWFLKNDFTYNFAFVGCGVFETLRIYLKTWRAFIGILTNSNNMVSFLNLSKINHLKSFRFLRRLETRLWDSETVQNVTDVRWVFACRSFAPFPNKEILVP